MMIVALEILMKLLAMTASLALFAATGALAETTCQSVDTDLTGSNLYGQHTIAQLRHDAEAGNCGAAAYLARRAKDAQGFLGTHCPSETQMRDTAADMLKLAEGMLQTPQCQN